MEKNLKQCNFKITEERKKVWKVQTDLLSKFISLCEKYDLKYILYAGTLLGAIRHNGFIPWDDDIDVGMPRKDFDRFNEICNKDISEPYFLDNFTNNPKMINGFSRLRNNNSTAFRSDVVNYDFPLSSGIFIDIFPFDNLPNNKLSRFIFRKRVWFFKRLVNNSPIIKHDRVKSISRRLFISFVAFLCLFVKPKSLYNHFIKISTKYKNCKCSQSQMITFSQGKKGFIIENADFDFIIKHKFEDLEANIPADFDRILKTAYGDYMTPIQGTQKHEICFFDPDNSFNLYKDSYAKIIDNDLYEN